MFLVVRLKLEFLEKDLTWDTMIKMFVNIVSDERHYKRKSKSNTELNGILTKLFRKSLEYVAYIL